MKSFEERLARLEELAALIRDRDVPIEEAMTLFDEGVDLSKGLEGELKSFERKIEVLSNEPPVDGGGRAELEEFD